MNVHQIAKTLGGRGGRIRALRLSVAERRRIASAGGKARAASLEAAQGITENLRYAAVLQDLRGEPTAVRRLRTFEGPLPGIYPARW
jgi:hypothetical protein